jgi:hypothetical protein
MNDTVHSEEGDGAISAPGGIDIQPAEPAGGLSHGVRVTYGWDDGTLAPSVIQYDEDGSEPGYPDAASDFSRFFPHDSYGFEAPHTGTYRIGVTGLSGGTGPHGVRVS